MEKKYLWILFLLATVFTQQTIEEVDIETTTVLTTLSANSAHYYKVTIPSNTVPNSHFLIFNVIPSDDDISDPDIYISENHTFPTIETSQWSCQAYGQDVCLVPKESIYPNGIFYAAVFCKDKCHYKLSIELRSELYLEEGIQTLGTLKADKSRLYRFNVPKDATMTSFSVNLELLNAKSSVVRMFIAQANNLSAPSSENTVSVIPNWLGLTAKIFEDDKYFCTGCAFRVLITSKEDIEYKITYKISKLYTKLQEDKNLLFDYIKRGERNCYLYKIQSREDLEIRLNPFSGNPKIYVHPNELPMSMDKFAYNSTGTNNEALIIPAKEIYNTNYFICIFGLESSAYQLTVSTQKPNKVYPLSCGYTHTMSVEEGELILFMYPLKSKGKVNVTFTLVSITGDADLYLKKCKVKLNDYGLEENECNLSKDELQDNEILKSTNTSSIDLLKVESHPCSSKTSCSFLIGVYGFIYSKFSLTASCTDRYQITLAESTPYYGLVESKAYSYFVFTVDNPLAVSVKIQLTSNAGNADLFVSRISPFCNSSQAEYTSVLVEHLPDTVIYTKERDGFLNSTYYVSIYGTTYAFFSLVYSVDYGDLRLVPVKLYDGFPMIGSLNGTESVLYNFDIEEHEEFKVFVSTIHGDIEAYIEIGSIPTKEKYSWRLLPFENTISLKNKGKNKYFLLITKRNKESKAIFSVEYVTGKHIISLIEGYPAIGNTTKGLSDFYKYYVGAFESEVIITVTPFLGNPDLYISISPNNKMPTKKEYDYASTRIGADSMIVAKEELMKKNSACRSSIFSVMDCMIYIGVHCASQECLYTLQVSQSGNIAVRLIEGIPLFGIVENDKPQFYSVMIDESNSINEAVVSIQLKSGYIKAYSLFVSNFETPANESERLPSPFRYDTISFERTKAEVLVLKKEGFKDCGLLCKYLIGIYSDNKTSEGSKAEYVITATSNFRRLVDGQTVVDYVEALAYRYYIFRVPCTTCTVSISLTPFTEGDPDLYILKGSYMLPNKNNFDFKSTSYRGEFLQLSPGLPFFYNKSISGTYTIGVHGLNNCSYSLVVTTSTGVIEELSLGIPITHTQTKGSIKHYRFFSWKKADIRIALTMYNGRTLIRANVVLNPSEANLLESLPMNERKSKWSSQSANTRNHLTISKFSKHFLSNATYLISVESPEDSMYDIVIEYLILEDYSMMKLGEPLYESLYEGTRRSYAFIVNNQDNITISLSVMRGFVSAKVASIKPENIHWTVPQNGKLTIETSKDLNAEIGMYYIIINTYKNSYFSLLVEQSLGLKTLLEGIPYTDIMINEEPLHFFYFLSPSSKSSNPVKRHFNVYVKFYEDVETAKLYLYEYDKLPLKKKAIYSIDYNKQSEYIGHNFDVTNFKSNIIIKLEVKFVNIENSVRYEVVAWTTGIVSMTPNLPYMSSFDSPGKMHTYELEVLNSSTVYIEVMQCLGEVEFFICDSLQQINDRKYDIKRATSRNGIIYGSFNAKQGIYYISVRGLTSSNMDPMKMIWYKIYQVPIDRIYPFATTKYTIENFGYITYSTSGNAITLSWGKAVDSKDRSKDIEEVTYNVYVSEQGKANMSTVCSIELTGAETIAKDIKENTFTWSIGEQYKGKELVFNVIAQLHELEQLVTYSPLEYSPRSKKLWLCKLKCNV